jgi:hypothetical protein
MHQTPIVAGSCPGETSRIMPNITQTHSILITPPTTGTHKTIHGRRPDYGLVGQFLTCLERGRQENRRVGRDRIKAGRRSDFGMSMNQNHKTEKSTRNNRSRIRKMSKNSGERKGKAKMGSGRTTAARLYDQPWHFPFSCETDKSEINELNESDKMWLCVREWKEVWVSAMWRSCAEVAVWICPRQSIRHQD